MELHVLVPGVVDPPAPGATGPTVRVRLTDGIEQNVPIGTSAEEVAAQVDQLYGYGGRRALTELYRGLVAAGAENAAQWCFEHDVRRREEIVRGLSAVSEVGAAKLNDALDQVRAHLDVERYGLVGRTGYARPPIASDGRETYRRFRADLAALDPLRRAVVRWTFTIPPNAVVARQQFEGERRRYADALAEAVRRWPVIAVIGTEFLADLDKKPAADVRAWGTGTDEGTALDDDLREAVADAESEAAEHRTDVQNDYAEEGSTALRRAQGSARPSTPSALPPEQMIGLDHPLWRHPFLVTAALEELGYRPESVGYAAATSALEYAEDAAIARREERARTERVLGWAVLGFGLLALVPVVGLLATAALITVQAVVVVDHAMAHMDAHARAAAFGPAAARFGYADPDGLGLLVEVLGLGADVLPLIGPAVVGLSRRAGVLVRARAVEAAADTAGHASALASLAGDLAAKATEKEAARLGLDRPPP